MFWEEGGAYAGALLLDVRKKRGKRHKNPFTHVACLTGKAENWRKLLPLAENWYEQAGKGNLDVFNQENLALLVEQPGHSYLIANTCISLSPRYLRKRCSTAAAA